MILKFFFSKPHSAAEPLHDALVAASRQPAFFLGRYGLRDRREDRIELLFLHCFLLARRLNACPAPGPQIAQDLTDRLFVGLERALREEGMGDAGVARRMKQWGADYNGRALACSNALESGDEEALLTVLARNVLNGASAEAAAPLGRYVRAVIIDLDANDAPELIAGRVAFPTATVFE